MSLIEEYYKVDLQIKQLEERKVSLREELIEEHTPGEILDVGNGIKYIYTLTNRLEFGKEASEVIRKIPNIASFFEFKINKDMLEKLERKGALTDQARKLIEAKAKVEQIPTLRIYEVEKVVI